MKRASDLLLTSILLLVALPVILLAALGSALVLRAWPFFVQLRVGMHERQFKFLKIRTLPLATPAYVIKHRLIKDRIPPFVRLLRALHFDELPQLLLVFTGRMSLVGPRPEMQECHDLLDEDFARERTSVRPGCTGMWQISVAKDDMIGSAPEYDRFYIQHQSVRLDLWIIARTIRQMVGLGGRVTLADVPHWAAPNAERATPLTPATADVD
jgi:lipopolysaccharide/colanic/teichoic acid biosynthesis glycosyltransferase